MESARIMSSPGDRLKRVSSTIPPSRSHSQLHHSTSRASAGSARSKRRHSLRSPARSYKSNSRKTKLDVQSELLDLDVLKASTLFNTKPSKNDFEAARLGFFRVVFFPFYGAYWAQQGSRAKWLCYTMIASLQVFGILIYTRVPNKDYTELRKLEVMMPIFLLIICGLGYGRIQGFLSPRRKKTFVVTKRPGLPPYIRSRRVYRAESDGQRDAALHSETDSSDTTGETSSDCTSESELGFRPLEDEPYQRLQALQTIAAMHSDQESTVTSKSASAATEQPTSCQQSGAETELSASFATLSPPQIDNPEASTLLERRRKRLGRTPSSPFSPRSSAMRTQSPASRSKERYKGSAAHFQSISVSSAVARELTPQNSADFSPGGSLKIHPGEHGLSKQDIKQRGIIDLKDLKSITPRQKRRSRRLSVDPSDGRRITEDSSSESSKIESPVRAHVSTKSVSGRSRKYPHGSMQDANLKPAGSPFSSSSRKKSTRHQAAQEAATDSDTASYHSPKFLLPVDANTLAKDTARKLSRNSEDSVNKEFDLNPLDSDNDEDLMYSTRTVNVIKWSEDGLPIKEPMSVLRLRKAIIDKVKSHPASHLYHNAAPWGAAIIATCPSMYRLLSGHQDVVSCVASTVIQAAASQCVSHDGSQKAGPVAYGPAPHVKSIDEVYQRLWQVTPVLFGSGFQTVFISVISMISTFILAALFFLELAEAETTYYRRLIYAKSFAAMTSSRRARRARLPHFRLKNAMNIKAWLSLRAGRAWLKRQGKQRAADAVVSSCFILDLCLVAFMMVQLAYAEKNDSREIFYSLLSVEVFAWCSVLSFYVLRFMMLGSRINKKYQNSGLLLTEQMNIHLRLMHYTNNKQKKESLTMSHCVLKVATKLLKELEKPNKISGVTMNPFLYNFTRVLVLSAFSATVSEVLGFKLKVWKMKM